MRSRSPLGLVWHVLRNAGDRKRLEDFRDRALRRLVTHAYARVPYYRELFDRTGLAPRDIRTASDLRFLPPSSKEDLRRGPVEELLASGVSRDELRASSTTGSTGVPFTIYRTRSEQLATRAFNLRMLRSYGAGGRDRVALVSRGGGGRPPALLALLRGFGLFERHGIGMLQPPAKIAAALRDLRPDIIVGNATVLLEVARVIRRDGGPALRPRLVLTSGGSRLQS